MEKEQFLEKVSDITEIERAFDKLNGRLGNVFGADSIAENSFLPLFFKMRDTAITLLSELCGDKDRWLIWYFDDVLITSGGLSATINGEKINCEDAEDIWEIIQKSTEQFGKEQSGNEQREKKT